MARPPVPWTKDLRVKELQKEKEIDCGINPMKAGQPKRGLAGIHETSQGNMTDHTPNFKSKPNSN